MGMSWTKEQQEVIRLRNRNLLVSAAAGSGKTAVLVERILNKIMDPDHPIDIDRLLIMTFTRAAAGEMKERISRALENALCENPENEHLQKQMTRIHTAQITTIDGFCAYVIRNYFHTINLDPGYRVADEGELKLLREDVLKELTEECYREKDPAFVKFVECYAPGKTDDNLKDLIIGLYQAAMSHPDPEEWLEHCLKIYHITTEEELYDSRWLQKLWQTADEELTGAEELIRQARQISRIPGGPYLYEEALISDQAGIEAVRKALGKQDYEQVRSLLMDFSYQRLSGKKPEVPVDEEKKEQVKSLRDDMKTSLKDLGSRYFQNSTAEILEALQYGKEPMETLVKLTLEFKKQFTVKKREKNILDFTDMEHLALAILVKDGKPSDVARELSEKYEEVLVDEYQDSNLVQEMITYCVSGEVSGRKNIFMVGDVKQSIYRFRLARPDLFMDKMETYTLEESKEQRIDLHKNFRSRHQVLDSVNYLFHQIMKPDLGGVGYDDRAALYPGAEFPKGGNKEFYTTEVLLVEKDGEEVEDLMEGSSQKVRELEALAVAHRIRQIVGKEQIYDRKKEEYRPAGYNDIVVLLRSASGWAESFSQVFSAQGIPSYAASKTGYFSATEVVTVLNLLKVCDNPYQDIPLCGVLHSPIIGCSSQELASLRCGYPKGKLFESVLSCIMDSEKSLEEKKIDKQFQEKLQDFYKLLEDLRDMAVYTPVHKLISAALKKTGYGDYARALPDGAQRNANLAMLVEKAMDYEKTSYRGLFNFIRYIEHLQKYEVDYGEVNLADAGEGAVQIMTIHKSKGLEFPIVFASGMGKAFNFQDLNARLLIHPELGLGADAIIPEKRIIASTLHKQIIRRELQKESLGEELRILYVALTRAKEKLFITGCVGKMEKLMHVLYRFRDSGTPFLPLDVRMKGKTCWSYILPALAQHPAMDPLFEEYGMPAGCNTLLYRTKIPFLIKKITVKDLTGEEVIHQAQGQMEEEILRSWDKNRVFDEKLREELKERFDYRYPFEYLKELPVKVSVSELKKRNYPDEYEKEEAVFFEPDIVPLIPKFCMVTEEEYTGAARGTACHRFMECLMYDKTDSKEELLKQLQMLVQQEKMSQEEADCIKIQEVLAFLNSPLGVRMKAAWLEKRLYREQPFVIARSAEELDKTWAGKREPVLIQGIIDAYFEEEKDLVLVDYKTDHIRFGEESRLVDLYKVQLEDYADALERMTGKKVKEKIIYSFAVHKEILV